MDNPFIFSWKGKVHAKKNEREIIPPKKPGGNYALIPPREYYKQEREIRGLLPTALIKSGFDIIPRKEDVLYVVRFCVYKTPTSNNQKGDHDNMLTSILDIFNTVVYEDDAQVKGGFPLLRPVPNALLEHFKIAIWAMDSEINEADQLYSVYNKYFRGANG